MILNPRVQESQKFSQLFYDVVRDFPGLFFLRTRRKHRL